MNPHPVHRLPAALEAAVQRIKLAARQATERTIESLGLAALASNNAFQRDGLLGAQFELNRKSAVFALAFNEEFDRRVLREVAPRSGEDSTQSPSWESLRLVEDRELEIEVAAERFGLEAAHACEWELRELGAYVGALLGSAGGERERNPLRPEVVGHAMYQAVETVSDRPEVRDALAREMARSLGTLLRSTYAEIVADLRRAGVQPAGLTVRNTESRSGAPSTGFGASERAAESERAALGPEVDSRWGSRRSGSSFGPSTRSGHAAGRGTPLGDVDPAMMALMRRIAFAEAAAMADAADAGLAGGPALPNLIHAHRDELRQAAGGSLDLMVIDVIGSLFDQILSDPKVPPQIAREIARLQLPVLRAALGDPSFFSSRRHPVRRFVNRIASLGAGFDDIGDAGAQRVLGRIRELVDEVVQGDFDQLELYQSKLAALEAFVAEQGRDEVRAQGDAAELLAAKEDELRLRQLYAQQLHGELKGLSAPEFLRDFISQVWSQAVVAASERDGAEAESVRRLRQVGRELFMSVQPKTSSAQRKSFLAELPKLMKDLGEGLDLIGWPEASRREFFGRLLPAHAESLKAQPVRPLDINLLAREVDGALQRPLPSREALRAAPANLPVLDEVIAEPSFSAEEAARVGLVDESQIDWNGQIDIVIGEDAPVTTADTAIGGLPTPSEPVEPTEGRALAEHVQVGFAYRMHIGEAWQKVRLVHVSAGRTFFVFHHGTRHKETVSLTQRMLVRLCETGRLRAYENAYLLERATARARRQLAAMGSAGA
ncbi:DUF1631 family protein [Rubrivivax gelatinosus]|uniref:Thymidine phosphorylase n=2 Tax=Rubrivivax gelatinosus TaxID=28068 RepID=I0HN00_RUBGI|nr:DUF1631 family protein [Rubrivivax gelatinosus]BAL94387.1 hypothetical protein RGE_10460 [Rubrivivax gelatinosus IL144]